MSRERDELLCECGFDSSECECWKDNESSMWDH